MNDDTLTYRSLNNIINIVSARSENFIWIFFIKLNAFAKSIFLYMSMVSCQKGPTRHAYAWQIGPFWQDTLDVWTDFEYNFIEMGSCGWDWW